MAIRYVDELGTTGIPAVGSQALGSVAETGRLRFVERTYTMVGTESNADYINICKLYKGEKVYANLSDVLCTVDIAGASTTLDIGDDDASGSDTRYASQIDVAAVGRDAFDETTINYTITEDSCWLRASFAVVNTPAAGGKIVFRVAIREA